MGKCFSFKEMLCLAGVRLNGKPREDFRFRVSICLNMSFLFWVLDAWDVWILEVD